MFQQGGNRTEMTTHDDLKDPWKEEIGNPVPTVV